MAGSGFRERVISRSIAGAFLVVGLAACGQSEPSVQNGPGRVRQITETQYRNTIRDIFGDGVTVVSRFDAPRRENGLLAVGAGTADVTPAALERFDNLARAIAVQVIDKQHRDILVPCKPAVENKPDDACAARFLGGVGRLLFRRPLAEDELQAHVATAHHGAEARSDFYAGLGFALSGLLVAPPFLFAADFAEADTANPGRERLTAFAKATRLSYLLWDSAPDDALLTAAEKGELHSKDGLARQVDRMLHSPALETGVRAFFTDMLAFDAFDELAKDSVIYPAFNTALSADMKEQTLRTIVDALVTRGQDYRELFTTRRTFLTRRLAVVYRAHVLTDVAWISHEFEEGDPHVGIQSHLSFVALHSHPGRSSPTLRGKAVRELLLCQRVPPPPGDVDFNLFNDPEAAGKTVRERLTAHRTNPSCAGCHKIMDPIGLTMENFDGLGQFRTAENGGTIDVTGEIDNRAFDGPSGLGKVLHDDPAAASCVVDRLLAYAMGRAPTSGERAWAAYQQQRFAAHGYRFVDLLREIATSDAFYGVTTDPAPPAQAVDPTASPQENRS